MTKIRKLLFLPVLTGIILNSYAQIGAVVAADKQNVLYTGIDNPVSIAIPGYTCEQTYATINNGTLSGSGCIYNARPEATGNTLIYVFSIAVNDSLADTALIGQFIFRTKQLPDPVVKISGLRNETITKGVLMAQKGLYAVLEGFDIEAKYKITSFWVRHYSSNSKIKDVYNEGTLFNEETKDMFHSSFKGDIFRFDGIKAIAPDGRELDLEPIELYVDTKF